METIKLRVSKEFYGKFLTIIEKCDPEDLQIVEDGYQSVKDHLEEQFHDLDSKSAEFLTIDELDVLLEKILVKHAG